MVLTTNSFFEALGVFDATDPQHYPLFLFFLKFNFSDTSGREQEHHLQFP
jgi:hypothetical protein